MKRGISPLISSVLLIAFVITLFLVITNWIQGGVIEDTTSATNEKLAGQLDCFSADVSISNVCADATGTNVAMNIDNDGTAQLTGVIIRALNADGDVGTTTVTQSAAPLARVLNRNSGGSINLQALTPSVTGINRIEVYPILESGTCQDKLATTSNIGVC
jgi:flagellin-like protein